MGLSLRVIAPRGGQKVGGDFLFTIFEGLPFFSKIFKFRILKSFKKKSSIAQYCAIDLLDL